MSHIATNWAWQIKGLRPSTKIVLLHLADRHNPDNGCFPSINLLARDCEMSVRTVHSKLDELEKKSLIRRIPRHRPNGSQTSNEYLLMINPMQNLQGGSEKIAGETPQKLPTHNHVSNNLVNEQNIFWEKIFEEMWYLYPKRVGKGAAKQAWMKACKKINVGELSSCLRAYISSIKNLDKKFIPHLSTWLNQERWNDDIEDHSNIDSSFRNIVNDIARARND